MPDEIDTSECVECGCLLDWQGDKPDEQEEVLCYACQLDAMNAEINQLRTERDSLRAEVERLRCALTMHATVYGGGPHHSDDCEESETCLYCQTNAQVHYALTRRAALTPPQDATEEKGGG